MLTNEIRCGLDQAMQNPVIRDALMYLMRPEELFALLEDLGIYVAVRETQRILAYIKIKLNEQ